jgi:choline-sulfatase
MRALLTIPCLLAATALPFTAQGADKRDVEPGTAKIISKQLPNALGGERPNVLFIITDQQSADVMSCRMGNEYIDTPAMDRLAANGILFTRAYSSNPLCMPLRNSLFTGRYPHETGVTMNARPEGGSLAPEFVCMGTYFRNAGYQTAYSGKWHLCLDEKNPATHGFEILDRKTRLTPPETDNYDARVSHAAVKFLGQKHGKPFLLVVSLMNPHNICEWARRGAGRKQRLSCGEIGTPPPSGQLPPAPANLAVPKNEPDGMTLIRQAYQVEDGKFPVGKFTAEDWRKQRWGFWSGATRPPFRGNSGTC